MLEKIRRFNAGRSIILVTVVILIMVVLFSGSTYAIYYSNYETDNLTYAGGLLQITSEFSGGNIKLVDLEPMEDEDGINLSSHTYTITNVGTVPYKFNLLMTVDSSGEIDSSYVKVQVNDFMPKLVSEYEDNVILSDTLLMPGDSIYVSLRVWLDSETPNSAIGGSFEANLSTDGWGIPVRYDEEAGVLAGSGTQADPYLIESIEDLVYFSDDVNSGSTYSGKYVKLRRSLSFTSDDSYVDPNAPIKDTSGNEVDYNGDGTVSGIKEELTTGTGFKPIGASLTYIFAGNFNGNGNEIQNLIISSPSLTYVGLFGTVSSSGTIENLTVTGNINIVNDVSARIGGIVGVGGGGTYTDLVNKVNIDVVSSFSSELHLAGVVANSTSPTVSNCVNYGKISAQKTADGSLLVGGVLAISNGEIQSLNYGKVVGSSTGADSLYIAGLVGYSAGDFSDSYNYGIVSKEDSLGTGGVYVGGLVGYFPSSSDSTYLIDSSLNEGLIIVGSSEMYGRVGGLVGQASTVTINESYNTGKIVVEAGSYNYLVGGIMGISTGGSVDLCYNSGDIYYNNSNSTTSGDVRVGGIWGGKTSSTNEISVSKSYNLGDIYVYVPNINNVRIGGISGYLDSADVITASYNLGKMEVQSISGYVGGISPYAAGVIIASYNGGDILYKGSEAKIGGVVAYAYGSTITSSYNYGSFSYDEVGSASGMGYLATGTMSYVYSTSISGGLLNSGGTYSNVNSYASDYMKTSSFITEINQGLTDSSYSFVADTNNINGGYPILSWQTS